MIAGGTTSDPVDDIVAFKMDRHILSMLNVILEEGKCSLRMCYSR